jgi:hypothetical protein
LEKTGSAYEVLVEKDEDIKSCGRPKLKAMKILNIP